MTILFEYGGVTLCPFLSLVKNRRWCIDEAIEAIGTIEHALTNANYISIEGYRMTSLVEHQYKELFQKEEHEYLCLDELGVKLLCLEMCRREIDRFYKEFDVYQKRKQFKLIN
jgi:DNA-directed RNA polymerase subunit N (RpoN/RPB10)